MALEDPRPNPLPRDALVRNCGISQVQQVLFGQRLGKVGLSPEKVRMTYVSYPSFHPLFCVRTRGFWYQCVVQTAVPPQSESCRATTEWILKKHLS